MHSKHYVKHVFYAVSGWSSRLPLGHMREPSANPILVAITGPLSEPRSAVVDLINSTENGLFVDYITMATHYLVASTYTSNKAKKAARWGTTVISEGELREYLEAKRFPSTKLPVKSARLANSNPEVVWIEKPSPELCVLTYCNARGQGSIRHVLWTHTGQSLNCPADKFLGGFDGPHFKSWRHDRIAELEVLREYVEPSVVLDGDDPSLPRLS